MALESVKLDLVPDWEQCPPGEAYRHEDVAGVACDSQDRVYLHTRSGDRVSVYAEDGKFIDKWGDGVFGPTHAHGITIRNDAAYVTDHQSSVVRIFDLEGNMTSMLGQPGVVSDTGYADRPAPYAVHMSETVQRTGGPFNCCCNTAVSANGDIFVADGYGNACVHHFNSQGTLLNSWGGVGEGAGQFRLPHGIALDNDEKVIVCDRENDRLQFFDRSGRYLYEWNDIQRPTDACVDKDGLIYVSELWRPIEQGQGSFVHGYADRDLPGRVTIFRGDGKILARFGDDSNNRSAAGNFIAPHSVAVDSRGSLYVGEVSGTYGASTGRMRAEDCINHQIQKFARVG